MGIPFKIRCDMIAQQERVELVRLVIEASNTSVRYEFNGTLCPVCALVGVKSVLGIKSTQGEVRFCFCAACGSNIKAVGESKKAELEKITPKKEKTKEKPKTKTKKKK